jgi:hypothetical protein
VHAWLGGIIQKHDSNDVLPSYNGRGFDVGTKLSYGPATLTGYYYNGSGIGTTGLFILSTDSAGHRRNSYGYYAQATYTLGKITLGGSMAPASSGSRAPRRRIATAVTSSRSTIRRCSIATRATSGRRATA